jgi:hypothetical protein
MPSHVLVAIDHRRNRLGSACWRIADSDRDWHNIGAHVDVSGHMLRN